MVFLISNIYIYFLIFCANGISDFQYIYIFWFSTHVYYCWFFIYTYELNISDFLLWTYFLNSMHKYFCWFFMCSYIFTFHMSDYQCEYILSSDEKWLLMNEYYLCSCCLEGILIYISDDNIWYICIAVWCPLSRIQFSIAFCLRCTYCRFAFHARDLSQKRKGVMIFEYLFT